MFSSNRQSRPRGGKELRRTQATAWDASESARKPHRRICKLANVSPDSNDNDVRELYDSLPVFGPFYEGVTSMMPALKEAAWQHVLTKSPTEESETTRAYLSTVRRIERLARNTYTDDTVDHLKRSQFQWMMIKDGCFILQLALFALGGKEQLDHPPNHLIFGEQRNITKRIKKLTKSMFFVGNQIPLVVLRELMKQSFFQQVISRRKWERQYSDLFKRALYQLLVLPELKNSHHNRHRWFTSTDLLRGLSQKLGFQTRDYLLRQQPSDLLHGLQLLVIGPGNDPIEDDCEEDIIDLEGDGEDFGGDNFNTTGSATELRQAGIHFRHAKGIGLRGIKFTTNMFYAVLTLPTFTVEDDTELVFRYLRNYEIAQRLGRKREVSHYLQFMSELIRTPDDANLLASQGIIRANRNQREMLPGILSRLAAKDTNQNLRLVRLKIEDYSRPPWERIRGFLSLVLLLTVVQTVYTVLGYYKQP
uniref:Uncharacterized protein n=1 Tax=Davidia involucrata TaxID=16924 RepID=A0A5B7BKG5_DAVIN